MEIEHLQACLWTKTGSFSSQWHIMLEYEPSLPAVLLYCSYKKSGTSLSKPWGLKLKNSVWDWIKWERRSCLSCYPWMKRRTQYFFFLPLIGIGKSMHCSGAEALAQLCHQVTMWPRSKTSHVSQCSHSQHASSNPHSICENMSGYPGKRSLKMVFIEHVVGTGYLILFSFEWSVK